MPLTSDQEKLGLIALIAAGAGLVLYGASRFGVSIGPVSYLRVPGRQQVRSLVTVTNHTDIRSAWTLLGYQLRADRLQQYSPQPFGLPLHQAVTRLAQLASMNLIEGHWFATADIATNPSGVALNPTLAEQTRAIPVTAARGQRVQVGAWTATPEVVPGIANIWVLLPGAGVTNGTPVAQYTDPRPEMPPV